MQIHIADENFLQCFERERNFQILCKDHRIYREVTPIASLFDIKTITLLVTPLAPL